MRYTVKYRAGPYSGTRVVRAEDEDEAIEKVKAEIRREMTLPMYSCSCRVISDKEKYNED